MQHLAVSVVTCRLVVVIIWLQQQAELVSYTAVTVRTEHDTNEVALACIVAPAPSYTVLGFAFSVGPPSPPHPRSTLWYMGHPTVWDLVV